MLDAALGEFAAKGFAGARVRDIAQRAGVSKDLIAYHFGNKNGLYLAVQRAWLEREGSFSDAGLPLDELVARYLHDALDDPRPLRLLAWRGLGPRDSVPPDEAPPDDLATTRHRQAHGELPDDIEPAALHLILLACVAAPVVFADTTSKLFGMSPHDPEFEERYARSLRSLVAHLKPASARNDGADVDGNRAW